MPNQKGSLKDRLRSWLMFLNYKIKLKKQLKEQNKVQKKQIQINASGKFYNKYKVFGLTILGLFFGLFEGKESKFEKSIEQRIILLEKKLENHVLDVNIVNEIQNLEKDIIVFKGSKKTNDESKFNCEQRLNVIKTKINMQEELSSNIIDGKNSLINRSKINTNSSKSQKNKESPTTIEMVSPTKRCIYIPVLEIKLLNKDLKTYNKELKEINIQINKNDQYNNFYEYEFMIKQINIKLDELLTRYENLKLTPGFESLNDMISVIDFDEFCLRKDDKKIKESIALCENILITIEKTKEKMLSKKETKSVIEKKEETKEVKQEENKEQKVEDKDKNKLFEVMLANKIIYDNLIKEQRKINKFNRLVANMNVVKKRHNVFYYTKNLVYSILNFSFSVFPLSLFKNKMLGSLVSGIMINNSLRSVRKILNPDIDINYIYDNLEQEILSTSVCLNRISSICSDSLKQIEDIRNTLLIQYGNDIKYSDSLSLYFEDLNKIENQIRYEQVTILGMNEELNIINKKNKRKIKTIKHHFN